MFTTAPFTTASTWKQPGCPSTGKWIMKLWHIYIYNGILLSHKEENIWVSYNEVDEPRACYTEWSKSEREEQILHIHICIWNLERCYWWTYLQGSNEDADIVNRFLDTLGEWKDGTNRATLKLIHYCNTTSLWEFAVRCRKLKPGDLWQPQGVGGGGRWAESSTGRWHMSACGWFILMYGRNQHNIVRQLSSN